MKDPRQINIVILHKFLDSLLHIPLVQVLRENLIIHFNCEFAFLSNHHLKENKEQKCLIRVLTNYFIFWWNVYLLEEVNVLIHRHFIKELREEVGKIFQIVFK